MEFNGQRRIQSRMEMQWFKTAPMNGGIKSEQSEQNEQANPTIVIGATSGKTSMFETRKKMFAVWKKKTWIGNTASCAARHVPMMLAIAADILEVPNWQAAES